jgi:WD40 repeat protein
MIDKKTETTQPIIIPTSTQVKTTPVSSTPTRTQEVTSKPVTDTPAPSKTKTQTLVSITPIPTSTNFLDGKLIILREFTVNYLEDILSGRGNILFAEGKSIDILRWAGNGCTLIVATRDEIVKMDLQGKILQTIFSFDQLPSITDGVILSPPSTGRRAIDALSPDETWIAYKIGSGSYEQRGDDLEPIRYEYENLETMSVDGTQGPYRLSQNGGAWRAAWSPDSKQIAYSDYDEKGIHQLFIINKDGTNRRQVTSFTHPRMKGTSLTYPAGEILKIIWSPNGEKIASLVDQGDHWSTIVLNIDGKSSEALENISAEWWRDNNSLVAWKIIEQEPRHAELITLDTNTNKEFTIRPEGCHRINQFGNPSMIGCMTLDYDFFVYDTKSGNAVMYPKFDPNRLEIHYWIAAPDSYPGVNGCGFTP